MAAVCFIQLMYSSVYLSDAILDIILLDYIVYYKLLISCLIFFRQTIHRPHKLDERHLQALENQAFTLSDNIRLAFVHRFFFQFKSRNNFVQLTYLFGLRIECLVGILLNVKWHMANRRRKKVELKTS